MKRATKAKRAAKKLPPVIVSEYDMIRFEAMEKRLRRAADVLSCADYCASQDAEVNVGALAVAARDLVDKALEDLSAFNRGVRGLIATMKGHNNG